MHTSIQIHRHSDTAQQLGAKSLWLPLRHTIEKQSADLAEDEEENSTE